MFGAPPATTAGKTIQQMIEEKGCTTLDWTPTNGVVSPFVVAAREEAAAAAAAETEAVA